LNVLVLAPHADDEVLGCGGVIRRHVLEGDVVTIAVMTNAARGAPELFGEAVIDVIRAEARRAAARLGVRDIVFRDFPGPQLDQFPTYRLANAISELIGEYCTNTLYIPFQGDLHTDHGAVFKAALVAARPMPGASVRRVYCYETLSETEWAAPFASNAFLPVRYVNIEQQLRDKLDAMGCYASQLRPFPHPRSLEAMQTLAKLRGSQCGCAAAETFGVIREIVD
jgi:LmbE family N-acetylglucosaminyl deacetylase